MPTDIRLARLHIQNFKGTKETILPAFGQNLSIYGENATGKTTIADSINWLLFDKNTENKKDFSIKPHDQNGQEIHFLETVVEAILSINGVDLKLRKMFCEKWTRKHGQSSKEFTGHETSYWVDDVPVKKNEYQAKINSVINENIFKLLTNPFFFNTQLSWQDRRKTLLEIAGDISDADVIASSSDLAKLTEILGGKSTDNYRKILNERMKKVNDDIAQIPIKINELTRTLITEQNVDYDALDQALAENRQTLQGIEQELVSASSGAKAYQEKQQKAFRARNDLDARQRVLDGQTGALLKQLVDEKGKLESGKYLIDATLRTAKDQIEQKCKFILDAERQLAELRTEFGKENAKTFVEPDPDNFICPTCGQDLPEDTKTDKVLQLKTNFDNSKTLALNKINSEGRALREKVDQTKDEIQQLTEKSNLAEANLADINERLAELAEEIASEQATDSKPNYDTDLTYASLKAELQALQAELEMPIADVASGLWDQKRQTSEKIEQLNRVLNNRDIAEKTRARIDELKGEERTLAQQYSEMEGQKYLIEQFIKQKVALQEDGIASRFKMVRFKMFDQLVNGGIAECCETLVNTNGAWVPFVDANHAGQINSGIDIINTLSAHYGVTAPIFCDNAEAVNELTEAMGQMIRLVVSQDKELRVEVAA